MDHRRRTTGNTAGPPDVLLVCDLHTHTLYSRDCLTSLEDFLRTCQRRGLDRVAVTDHNTIVGALRLKEMDPERIIVGEEIRTTHGELIAYFLTEEVPPARSPEETVELVHAQGGVVGVSHPFDVVRREAMGRAAVVSLLGRLDFVEAFNARSLLPACNRAARAFALQHGLPMTAGSDAHCAWELGRGAVLLPSFDSPTAFLDSLRSGTIRGRPTPPWIHFVSVYARVVRRLGRPPLPDAA